MTWIKKDKEDGFSLICTEGKLKDSAVGVRLQDQVEKNRYCEIILRGNKETIYRNLLEKIGAKCNEIKKGVNTLGIPFEIYTFIFPAGNKASLFLECIDLIHRDCPIDHILKTALTQTVGNYNTPALSNLAAVPLSNERAFFKRKDNNEEAIEPVKKAIKHNPPSP